MKSLRAKLEAFQRSRAGLFIKKVMDDQAPNLASLLAWGTLSAILPLILGVLSVAGLLLRDPQRLDQIYSTVLALVPTQAAGPIGDALQGMRASAAGVGVVALLLLLFNGSSFFSNMASVFDQAYHVQTRNFVMERLVAIGMLIVTTLLLVVATLAVGLGSLVGNVPIGSLPIGPTVAPVITWSISLLSAFLLFLLGYRILPNTRQRWRSVLPGAILASVLTFVISMVFPLYVTLFPPNHAYAVFGVFLLFTFWLYVLGFIIVLGAELNAFLEQPARSVALAEATAAAPPTQGGTLGTPTRSPRDQIGQRGKPGALTPALSQRERDRVSGPSLAGRLLGFVGLLVAVLLLRGRTAKPTDERVGA